MRKCNKCGLSKEHVFFHYDIHEQRYLYKDEHGGIWHGRVCWSCCKGSIKAYRGKRQLGPYKCATCGLEGIRKAIRQLTCSRACYVKFINSARK